MKSPFLSFISIAFISLTLLSACTNDSSQSTNTDSGNSNAFKSTEDSVVVELSVLVD